MDKKEFLARLGVPVAVLSQLSDAASGTPKASGSGSNVVVPSQASAAALPVAPAAAAFAIDAPRLGKGGNSSIEVDAVYSLFWIGPNPSAAISRANQPFDKGITLGIQVPGKGSVILGAHLEGPQDFAQGIAAAWNIAADAEGTLKIEPNGSPEWGQPEGDAVYLVDSATQSQTSTSASLNLVIIGTSETQSTDHSTSVTVGGGAEKDGVGGSVSVSHTRGGGTSTTTANPKVTTSITITFNPVKAKAPPKPPPKQPPPSAPKDPEVTVTVDDVKVVLITSEYTIGPFVTDSIELKGGDLRGRVREIFKSLPEITQDDLIQGKLPGEKKIVVHGYADNQGPKAHNDALSKKRAEAVIKEFSEIGVPDASFTKAIPEGEREVSDPADPDVGPTDDAKKEKPMAEWRKVVVYITHPP
jgi:outer membrane protein OmpA-like peptidoglycan-associated protein